MAKKPRLLIKINHPIISEEADEIEDAVIKTLSDYGINATMIDEITGNTTTADSLKEHDAVIQWVDLTDELEFNDGVDLPEDVDPEREDMMSPEDIRAVIEDWFGSMLDAFGLEEVINHSSLNDAEREWAHKHLQWAVIIADNQLGDDDLCEWGDL